MLHLESDDQAPRLLMRTMYDLMYLAFRTDSTRVATYQITNMADASSNAGKFPQLEGFKSNLHGLAHGWNKPEGAVKLGQFGPLNVHIAPTHLHHKHTERQSLLLASNTHICATFVLWMAIGAL